MKVSAALAVLLVLANAGAIWFVWMNRASEKIVTSTLPIAILAIIGIFLAGWVFGGEDDYSVVFPVSYMVDLRTKLEIEEPGIFTACRLLRRPSPVPQLKAQHPELFPGDLNYFARNVYQHLLQRSFVDFLTMLYRGSWRARALRFDIGSGGFAQYGPAPQDQPKGSRILKAVDIERALGQNWFAHIHTWPDPQLVLPPGSELVLTPPTGGGDDNSTSAMRISGPFCTVTLNVESVFPIRTVGEYRIMAGLSDEAVQDYATNTYVVRASIHYNRLRSGHPDMKMHREWAQQLVEELRTEFDEQRIWVRVKEMDMRTRHYPPETISPGHGRVPQKSH